MLKGIIAFLVRYSGLPFLIREVFCRRKVVIMVYHRPSAVTLRRHLEYIVKRYSVITLDTLVDALYAGDFSTLPPKPLVITIDDGFAENYDLLPVIKEFGIRPTLYITTGVVGTGRRLWFTFRDYAGNMELLGLSNEERARVLKEVDGYEREREYDGRQTLSYDELRGMAPHVDMQVHSRFHQYLPGCDEADREEEVCGSREDYRRLFGRPPAHFAYPMGEYCERDIDMLRRCGYRSARTIDIGFNGPGSDPFRLKITAGTDTGGLNMLAGHLCGVITRMEKVREAVCVRLAGTYGTAAKSGSGARICRK